jgi:hypothetical protein
MTFARILGITSLLKNKYSFKNNFCFILQKFSEKHTHDKKSGYCRVPGKSKND